MSAELISTLRHDGRRPDQLRTMRFQRGYTKAAAGSVLVEAGGTLVLCTASASPEVPPWLKEQNRGWVTAEYSMLPGSTSPRKPRDRGSKIDGRTTEIQRLIGRSLRAVVDMEQFPGWTITVDCDVLQADGGTRTLSISGAFVAMVDALRSLDLPAGANPFESSVAAVSVGLYKGCPILDLDYREDVDAEVDMNVVMTGGGRFVEIQGTGEEATFSDDDLAQLLKLARSGIAEISRLQRLSLEKAWPWPS